MMLYKRPLSYFFFPFLAFASLCLAEIPQNSLLHHTWKQYSRNGEEGIIETLLSRIGISRGFFVEIGAGNGISSCNTHFLAERGWKGVFIEEDPPLFSLLIAHTRTLWDVTCIQENVQKGSLNLPARSLDAIADHYFKEEDSVKGSLHILQERKHIPWIYQYDTMDLP